MNVLILAPLSAKTNQVERIVSSLERMNYYAIVALGSPAGEKPLSEVRKKMGLSMVIASDLVVTIAGWMDCPFCSFLKKACDMVDLTTVPDSNLITSPEILYKQ